VAISRTCQAGELLLRLQHLGGDATKLCVAMSPRDAVEQRLVGDRPECFFVSYVDEGLVFAVGHRVRLL